MLDLSSVEVVSLDVDGTVTNPDNSVSERTRSAIIALQEADLPVILATGRSLANTLELAAWLRLTAPIVTCNGAIVGDPATGKILRVTGMSAADTDAMADLHRRTGLAMTWWTAQHIYITDDDILRRALTDLGERDLRVGSPDSLIPADTVKAMLCGSKEVLDAAADEIRRTVPRAVRSMDKFFELSHAEGTKWSGLSFVLSRLRKSPAACLGVGDGGNDIVWLSRIGFPVSMGNASADVHAATRMSVTANPSDGLAALLESLLVARTRAARRTGAWQ